MLTKINFRRNYIWKLQKLAAFTFLCRCLKVGVSKKEPNEWDAALDEISEDDVLWHWNKQYFWGQETPTNLASYRAVRGYSSARYWDLYDATYRGVSVGFRPALEPLGPEPCSPDPLVGKKVKIYGPSWVLVEGILTGLDNYDLVLKAVSPLPAGCSWIREDQGQVIVSRDNLCWLKEA